MTQQSGRQKVEKRFLEALARVLQQTREPFEVVLNHLDVSVLEARVLNILRNGFKESGMLAFEISQTLEATNDLLDHLAEKNLVERSRTRERHAPQTWKLTSHGQNTLSEAYGIMEPIRAGALDKMSREELESAVLAMEDLAKKFGQRPPENADRTP